MEVLVGARTAQVGHRAHRHPADTLAEADLGQGGGLHVGGQGLGKLRTHGPDIGGGDEGVPGHDLPDPHPLADALKLETGYDADGKFMAGRELVSRDVIDAKTGEALIESVILGVSTVKSHPGKTLAGCTYSLDIPAEGEAPAAAPAPAKTTPPA